MQRLPLLATAFAAALALALPAAASAPAGWRAGSGVPEGSFTVLRAVDGASALAGGLGGALAVTHDGGASWAGATGPSDADIRDLASADGKTLFVLDVRGLLARSSDSGATWSALAIPSGVEPLALRAFGTKLLVAGRKALLVSSDGGDSFADVTPKLARSDVFRGADMAGSAPLVWGAHALLVSSDGGARWQHLRLPRLVHGDGILAVDFVSPRIGFVLTEFRRFFRTADGGHHWRESLGTGGAGADVSFSDRRHGWLAAPGFAGRFDGYVLRTGDGGVTWRPEAVAPRFLSHVAAARGSAYAIANEGSSLYAGHGGEPGRAVTVGFRPVPRVLRRRGTVVIRGRVSPALARVGVAVSMRSGARWIARFVHTDGRGVFRAKFTLLRRAAFVVQVPAVGRHGSAATKPVAVRVVRWR